MIDIEKTCRRLLWLQVTVMVLVVGVIIGTGFLAWWGYNLYQVNVEFDREKTALVREARGFCEEADREILYGWFAIAKDYFPQRELGQFDAWLSGNDEGLKRRMCLSVRHEIEGRLLRESGHWPTIGETEAYEPRLKLLYQTIGAKHDVWLCSSEAGKVESRQSLDELWQDFEAKKSTLARAIRCMRVKKGA